MSIERNPEIKNGKKYERLRLVIGFNKQPQVLEKLLETYEAAGHKNPQEYAIEILRQHLFCTRAR